MKPFIYILVVCIIPLSCLAQSSDSKINEIGLNVSLHNMYGVRFKTGTEKILFRVTLQSLTGQSLKTANGNKTTLFGYGLNFGIEKRNPISDNLSFYYGSDIITGISRISQQNQFAVNLDYSGGLGIVLGFNYNINSKMSFSTEIMPSIIYSKMKQTITNPADGQKTTGYNHYWTYGFNGSNNSLSSILFSGINNQLASFTISYRIGNKSK